MLLRRHKPLYLALTGATLLHLWLFNLPVPYKNLAMQNNNEVSKLSIKITRHPLESKTLEPQKSITQEEKKSELKSVKPTPEHTVSTRKKEQSDQSKARSEKIEPVSVIEPASIDRSDSAEPELPDNHQVVDNLIDSPEPSKSIPMIDPLQQWLAALQQRINQHRRYPRAALARNVQGDVEIEARVNPDGTLAEVKILSGPGLFRSASLKALRKSLPFSLPEGTRKPIKFRFSIHYRLK